MANVRENRNFVIRQRSSWIHNLYLFKAGLKLKLTRGRPHETRSKSLIAGLIEKVKNI